jgi:hypothetical protein
MTRTGIDRGELVDFLRHLFLFLHFVGLASLLGGFLTQMAAAEKRVVPAMLHGAITQLVTGVVLVGVDRNIDGEHVNNAKIGVKLAVLIVISVLLWINRAKPSISKGVFFAIGGLTAANIAIAVFWT